MRRRSRDKMLPHRLKLISLGVLFVLISLGVFSTRAGVHTRVYASASNTLNFQARLLTASGGIVPDGNYSVQFKLYNVSSGGSTQWTETQGTVPVRSGYLSVYLGTVTAFPSTIDWSQQQWLTMNINGDGEMNPRLQLTAVPNALHSNESDALRSGANLLTADNFAQLGPSAPQALNLALSALRLNQTGAGGLIQFQHNGSDVFTIVNNGDLTSSGSGTFSGGSLTLGSATQSGGLVLQDGAGKKVTIQSTTLGANRTLTAPDESGTICVQNSSNCGFVLSGGATGAFVNNGNSFGGNATLGTNDNYTLSFRTNNTNQLALDTSGNLDFLNGGLKIGGTSVLTSGRAIQNLTGVTSSGTITFSGLGAGLVQSSSGGVLSSGAVDRNSATFFNTALTVANGGTGTNTFTSNGLLYGNGTGAIQATSAGTGGQVLLANGSGVPTFTSLSGDVTVNSTGVTTVGADAVALGADTTGNYVANLGSLTGLSTTGNSGEGSTPTLSVLYGATANTAVQGNTTLTCPSGTGNLNGGGTAITLGTGGTCAALDTISNPTFSGLLTASKTGATAFAVTGAPTNSATSSLIQIGSAIASGNTATNGGTYIGLNAPASGNPGTAADFLNFQVNGTSKLKVDTTGLIDTAGGLAVGGTTVLTSGRAAQNLTGVSSSGTITFSGLSTGLVQSSSGTLSAGAVDRNSATFFNTALTVANGGTGAGTFTSNGVLFGNGTGALGVTLAGTTGQCLVATTGSAPAWGSCAGAGSGATLQAAYDNGNSITTSDGRNIAFTLADTTTDGNLLVNIASGSTGKFAVQGNSTDILSVTTAGGVAITGNTSVASGTFTSSGGIISLNAGSNFATNINTGGSTGTITLGGGSAPLVIDSTNFDVSSAGALSGITSISLSGAISGGTTYSGSGNINTTGGKLQTNSTDRVDNSGNLVNIGNITGTAAVTLSSTGGANALTVTSGSGTLVLGGSTNTIQRANSTLAVDVNNGGSDSTLTVTNSGAGVANLSVEGGITAGTNSAFSVNTNGDITGVSQLLDGSTTTNGTSGAFPPSTSLTVTSSTNFDVGNYVQISDTNCGGSGVNPCYAKITAKAGNVLTITPGLTWTSGKNVKEYHIPEIGGIDTSQALANRYGRGYFIAGVATGNGTTYYNENSIDTSLANFDLLTTLSSTLNIGSAATQINIGSSSGNTTIAGTVTFNGNTTAPSTGTSGYLSRSGSTLQPANSGDSFTTSGNISTTGSGTITSAGALTVQGGGANITGGLTLATGALNLTSGGITNTGSIAGASTIALSGAITGATSGNTINGLIINAGALSGISTLNASGLITGVGFTGGTGLIQNTGGLTSTGSISLNATASTNTTNIGTGNTSGQITIGGGSTPLVIDSTNFDVSSAGALSGITTIGLSGAITGATSGNTINGLIINSGALSGVSTINASGLITSVGHNAGTGLIQNTGGITSTGSISLNASASTNTTNIGTGTTSGQITIGGGSTPLIIDSTNFDVSSAGALSGITTIGLSGAITGATSGNTINGLIINSGALSGISTINASGLATTVGLTAGSGLVQGTGGLTFTGSISLNATASTNTTNIGTGNTSGQITIGGGSTPLVIDSTNFDVSSAGALSGITTIGLSGAITGATSGNTINGLIINSGALSGVSTVNASGLITSVGHNAGTGLIQNTGGLTSTGSISLNATASTNTTNIGTGNTSGQITIGGGSAPLVIDSTNFDVSSAGALSGITSIGLSGAITGATSGNTINGLIINSGALSGISTINTSGLATLGAGLNVTGDATISSHIFVPSSAFGTTTAQGHFNGTSTTRLGGFQSLDYSGSTYTFLGNNKYFDGTSWVDNGLGRVGSSFQIQDDSFTFYSFNTGATFTPRFTVASGGNVGIGTSGTPGALLSVGGTTGTFQVSSAGALTAVGVNSGTGLVQGTGGLTISGAAVSLNANSNFGTSINTGTSSGTITLGGGSAPLVIDSTNFDVSSAGALSGITTINTSGLITSVGLTAGAGLIQGTAGLTITGAAVSLNASSNFAVNIGTGTTTSTVTIGGGSAPLVIDSTHFDVSSAGALSGITTITASGNINTTAGVYQVNGVSGITVAACTAGQYIGNGVATAGGIITAGSCRNDATGLSDERLKKDITPVGSVLDRLKDVNVVTYNFRRDDFPSMNLDNGLQYGVIAQQLQQIFPELVSQRDDGYYQVNFQGLNFYNLKAVTELAAKVDSLSTGGASTDNGVSTGGTMRLDRDGKLQNITGLDLVAGGASISGGINNNSGGITNAGAISGATNIDAQSVTVNADSSSNILTLKKDSANVFTVFNNGALEIKLDANNTFAVKKADGSDVFSVNTNGGLVQIGGTTADDKTILLVLDSKNTDGDPTGVNGGQYYNSKTNKFRCYQNNQWQDCLPTTYTESILSSQPQRWLQPTTDLEYPGQPRNWIDLTNVESYRIVMNIDHTGISATNCRLQYAFQDSGPWTDLSPIDDGSIEIRGAGTLKTQWFHVNPDARKEVLVRIVCKDGNQVTTDSVGTIRMQIH